MAKTNLSSFSLLVRTFATRYLNKHEGIFYPGGFTYYPRHPNESPTDPAYQPTKLFLVKRIKPFKGNPYWEKKILKDFKLDGKEPAIIKNIPENNGRLWRIKHLIEITPIQFPHGEPTEEDINHTFLRENGDFLVAKKLELPKQRIEATEKFEKDPNKLDPDTVRRHCRQKWLSGW